MRVLLLLLFFGLVARAQPDDCPAIVEAALQSVSTACSATARNQACYGNLRLNATPQDGVTAFTFEQTGDIANVADIHTLQIAALDETLGEWGIALLRLQANFPDTVPGQNITLLAFGDVTLENAVPRAPEISVTATANARVRSAPTSEAGDNVLVVIPSGTSFSATGRTEAGDWLRVRVPEVLGAGLIGWVSTSVLSLGDALETLSVIEPTQAAFSPMQAFYFSSGLGDAPCAAAPDSGVLLQTPQGAGLVDFQVNGVSITLGSTVYLQAANNELRVNLIEGQAYVAAAGETALVPAGTFTSVSLSADGQSPISPPTDPQPYDEAALASLPVSTGTTPLPDAVAITPAVPADTIDRVIAQTFAPFGALSGSYTLVNIERITLSPIVGGGAQCAQFAQVGQTTFLNFTAAGLDQGSFGVLGPNGAGGFGDTPSAHDDPLYRTIPGSPAENAAVTYTVLSLRLIERKETFAYLAADGVSSGACQNIYTYEWLSP
ncbi:MAG: SH3 domain-containing protein [Chloroflexi bacterium]|nr:SH3 domain-containing protein [Chloroflexota bacterium]